MSSKAKQVEVKVPEDVDGLAWNTLRAEVRKRDISDYNKKREQLEAELKEYLRSSDETRNSDSENRELLKSAGITGMIRKYCPSCKYNSEYLSYKNKQVTYAIKREAKCAKYDRKEKCALIIKKAEVYED